MAGKDDTKNDTDEKAARRTAPEGDPLLECIESFVGQMEPERDGVPGREVRCVAKVTRVRSSSAVARRWPDKFAPMKTHFDELQEATNEPGRRRGEPRGDREAAEV